MAVLVSSVAVLVSGCPETHVPSSCVSSRECSAAGLVCDTTRGVCVECNTDEDCLFTDRACRDHACVTVTPCTSSVMCPGLVCDVTLGYCVECLTDADCPGDEVCDDSACEAPPTACTSDRMCSTMGEVCDLAAGTGILTRLLEPFGADLIAVEPVASMREQLVSRSPDLPAIAALAESLPFAGASLDALTVAQAFHWFDAERALAEFGRVLRVGGRFALLWNARDRSRDWVNEVWSVMDRVAA